MFRKSSSGFEREDEAAAEPQQASRTTARQEPRPPKVNFRDTTSAVSCLDFRVECLAAQLAGRVPPHAEGLPIRVDTKIRRGHGTSAVSFYDFRVKAFEFGAGVVGGELPVDAGLVRVAFGRPGDDLGDDRLDLIDASAEALTGQHA